MSTTQPALAGSSAHAGKTELGGRHSVDALSPDGSPDLVDLFATENNYHCPIYFSKDKDALAHEWPSHPLYDFPPIALLPQVIRRIREDR